MMKAQGSNAIKLLLAPLFAVTAFSFIGSSAAEDAMKNEDTFIDNLLGRMTLEEKVGQLSLYATSFEALNHDPVNPVFKPKPAEERFDEIRAGKVTGIFNGFGVDLLRRNQEVAVNESRLGIPLIFGADVIHGFRTVFPVPLAEAASFEPSLAERTARAAAQEATAAGISWNFAPMVDVSRDARWGRSVEGAGEDVLLNSLFASARVRGFQGADLSSFDTMLATPKHFAAYGAAIAGLDYNTVDISERTLRQHYLPPFKAAIDSGAGAIMSAFNEINGVPATADPFLLKQILRDEWDFDGFVVSDFNSDLELVAHGFAADEEDATSLALNAGLDMSMQSGLYNDHLVDLVRQGRVQESQIDTAVRRVLRYKFRLGLFDDPFRYFDKKREETLIGSQPIVDLARDAGRRSIVLLKNQGNVLPLAKDIKRLALIGPFARENEHLNGPWSIFGRNDESVNLADGIRSALMSPDSLIVVKGSGIEKAIDGGIDEAIAAASQADIVLLAVGEGQHMSGEAKSRADITIPKPQMELAKALKASGKPIVVLLRNGRPLAIPWLADNADAILVTWFLGSQMGHAVADVVFGDYNPSAKLPMTFPTASGQCPIYYNRKNTGRPDVPERADRFKARYIDTSSQPQYPFGYGLSYTQFNYTDLRLDAADIAHDQSLGVSVTLTNIGDRTGEEVVQLYVRDLVGSVTRPIRELQAFQKVSLAPGKSRTIRFDIDPHALGFWGPDMTWRVEPGRFEVFVGGSSEADLGAQFVLRGE